MKTYRIFDTKKSLLSQGNIIYSEKPIDAAKEYCKINYPDYFPKRSGGNSVSISVTEVVVEDGRVYLSGKPSVWYELKQK